jgi:hypothetical protein
MWYAFKKREKPLEKIGTRGRTGSICGFTDEGFPVKFGQVAVEVGKAGSINPQGSDLRTFVTAARQLHLDLQIAALQCADSQPGPLDERREETRPVFPRTTAEETLVEWDFRRRLDPDAPGFLRPSCAAAEVMGMPSGGVQRIGVVGGRQVYAHGAARRKVGFEIETVPDHSRHPAVDRPVGFHFGLDRVGRK